MIYNCHLACPESSNIILNQGLNLIQDLTISRSGAKDFRVYRLSRMRDAEKISAWQRKLTSASFVEPMLKYCLV
jgi:hypothetical protein